MRLEEVRALVTGGASGLGEGVVRMLAANGGKAVIFDLPGSRGAEIAAELGDGVFFVPVDVTDSEAVERAVSTASELLGSLTLLVSCAGISPPARVVNRRGEPFPLETFKRVVDINLIGAFDVLRRAAVVMSKGEPNDEGERGLIVNFGSVAAFEGQVGQAGYAASKGGIVGLTLPLARDLAEYGIRVMTICPGTIHTPMVEQVSPEVRATLESINVFPNRLGRPDDIASVVRACIEVSYLNGEVIRVDAGARMPPR